MQRLELSIVDNTGFIMDGTIFKSHVCFVTLLHIRYLFSLLYKILFNFFIF